MQLVDTNYTESGFVPFLDDLLDALCCRPARQVHELYGMAAGLRNQLWELSAAQARAVEVAAWPLVPALGMFQAELQGSFRLTGGRCAELCALLRAIRCIAHAAARDEDNLARIRYQRVDVAALTRDVCAAFEPLAADRDIRFSIEVPHRLVADADASRLQIVELNLLFNAFKHTPRKGDIRCTLHATTHRRELLLSVADAGPRLSPRQRIAIFDRARYMERSVFLPCEGVGFSLAASRDFVRLHGGDLTVAENHGSGLTFAARLPARAPRGVAVSDTSEREPDLPAHVAQVAARELAAEEALGTTPLILDDRSSVVIVEPNRAIHRILAEQLAADYNVVSAFDGSEGLRLAESVSADLILADLDAPGVQEGGMVRRARERADLADVPILLLGGGEDPVAEIGLLESGAQAIVHKPFLLPEVSVRVGNLVADKRARGVLNRLVDHHQHDLARLAEEVAFHQRELQVALEHVEEARNLAEGASRVKTNFLQMISHELRTPITALQLYLRTLEKTPEASRSPRIQASLDRLWHTSNRLMQVFETMLEWARVDSGRGQLTVETFGVAAAVAEVLSELDGYARQKGTELSVVEESDTGILVNNDRRLARTVLFNLVVRAIQITDDREVSVRISDRDGDCRVSIHDGARPLSAEERAALFDPFQSPTDLRWRGGEGSGLGLYVVRELAVALGGDITLEPLPGGNAVTLAIPHLPAGGQHRYLIP